MAEVLHVPDEVTNVRTLRSPGAVLDPATAAVVEAAVADAEARGRREGELAGRRAALEEVERAAVAVAVSLDRLTDELRSQRTLAATASLETVETVVAAVLDRIPPPEPMQLLDRVREAVDVLDADRIEVRLNPRDHAVLTAAVDDHRLELVADAAVACGDAVVGTPAAGAQLTRRALLDAAIGAVGEEQP